MWNFCIIVLSEKHCYTCLVNVNAGSAGSIDIDGSIKSVESFDDNHSTEEVAHDKWKKDNF